jgi:hypothetical protein
MKSACLAAKNNNRPLCFHCGVPLYETSAKLNAELDVAYAFSTLQPCIPLDVRKAYIMNEPGQ